MRSLFIPAIAAVVSLCAAEVYACNPVQLVAPQAVYAAPVQAQFVAPVYQPVVAAVQVQPVAYSAAILQQQVIVKQRVVNRRHPLRRAAQIVLPPYGGRQALRVGGCCN